jgi:hypothetical protein
MSWKIGLLRDLHKKHIPGRAVGRVPGIFTVGPFVFVLVGENFAFQDKFRFRRHLDINGLALDEFDRVAEQRTRDVEFIDLHRYLRAGCEVDRGMHADDNGNFEVLPA